MRTTAPEHFCLGSKWLALHSVYKDWADRFPKTVQNRNWRAQPRYFCKKEGMQGGGI